MMPTSTPMLILLRHGQAEPYRADDAGRALVPAGVAEVERSAAFLQQQGWLPRKLLASPYRRAQETAAIVQRQLAASTPLLTEPMLQPDCDAANTGSLLAALVDQPLLVATHMPLVSGLLRYFVGQDVGFATGSLAVLVKDAQRWRLLARFDPSEF